MADEQDFRGFNQQLIATFRETGGVGEVGPVHLDRLALLTTTGRRTGRPHTTPLGAVRDDDENLILLGSNMGAPVEPDWCANIRVDPHVTVEVTGATWQTDAEILTGDERTDARERWLAAMPALTEHERAAGGREIPLVRVRRE